MRRFALLLLLHHGLAQFFNQLECVIDNRSLETMWEYKLMHDLQECFNPYKSPVMNGTEPLIVRLKFFMKSFNFNSETQVFTALTWTVLLWKDDHYKWDPNEYDGLDTLLMSSHRMWTPDLILKNIIDDDGYELRYFYKPCQIASKGTIRCVVQRIFKVKCNTDLREFPYDAQYCRMEFGTQKTKHTKIQFDIGFKAIQYIEHGGDWAIKNYQQILDETSEKQLVLEFGLERHTVGLAAIVVYPSLIVSVLTLSSLLVDARVEHRLVVVCFSLMSHFYFLTDSTWEFPENTRDPPNLIMYYRGSFILTSILIAVSFVLKVMCRKNVPCPNWAISVNDFVYLKVVKFCVWPRWATKVGSSSDFVKDWTDFANIINTVSIFVSVIVYISLYCVFMPQPNSFEEPYDGY